MEEVTICYGMTETSPVSTQTGADDALDKRVSTVGQVHPTSRSRSSIRTPGASLAGRRASFCARLFGDARLLGRAGEDGRRHRRRRLDAHGDLATMDDDGYVNIVGRIKDLIIRGGENVYPREIEEFLYTHPDIVDVQVVGVPDARYGEEVMAWVKARDGAELTTEAVRAFCEGRIAHFKVPRYVQVTEEFPMTVTGKVQKYKMREAAIELLGLQDAARTETA
jgi:fatty-acyl-CoA synthase